MIQSAQSGLRTPQPDVIELVTETNDIHTLNPMLVLTKYGVLCLPSGTSPTLIAITVLPIAFRSWYSFSCPSRSNSKYTSSALLRATTTWRLFVVAQTIVLPCGTFHSLTRRSERTWRMPWGCTCSKASEPICWTARVGAEERNPVSWTSSIVSPIDRTSVPLTKERMI